LHQHNLKQVEKAESQAKEVTIPVVQEPPKTNSVDVRV